MIYKHQNKTTTFAEFLKKLQFNRGAFLGVVYAIFVLGLTMDSLVSAAEQVQFKRVPTQFIAALGDPNSSFGSGAQHWGIWQIDPGPRGVWLKDYEKLEEAGGQAPANWQFDSQDWWLEEHGLIMEKPDFPLRPGRYIVTGDREVTTMLTVSEKDQNGEQRWELDNDASLFDVTHLPCRSARYSPLPGFESCSPLVANQAAFPVTPGAVMPAVVGCSKQDYAVLFVIAVALDN